MSKSIVLYLHVHQPYRVRPYTVFDIGVNHDYFSDSTPNALTNNAFIIRKIAEKSYIPTNRRLLRILERHPEFHLSLSLTGTVIEQLQTWSPVALQSFKDLVSTGRVEILGETYHHSLAFFYSRGEFERQVGLHRDKIREIFGQTPVVFRNTELAYNNDLAYWADKAGYKGILAEGWGGILDWRSANYVYEPTYTDHIRLLLKNYRLSDDVAFRFGDKSWAGWPLTAEKFAGWLNATDHAEVFNLFMDYETFGEHQWDHTGIFEFLEQLPKEWLKQEGNGFMTVSQAIESHEPADRIDAPDTITWADVERDLSAWLGNKMQTEAITALYGLERKIMKTGDPVLLEDWRRLQTSDHFYYMCTKWFNDGDIHAYFSPYENPYDAFITYINAFHDLQYRLSDHGVEV
ncbi:MAG TPA: glycoside hydrolase family 57 protein [Candidatus Saccharimonadales bacterium]|nr:glycoside hydrolase family 57 protein [Candidatus Saccharimonadales bacterium]